MDIFRFPLRLSVRIEIIVPESESMDDMMKQFRFSAGAEHLVETDTAGAEGVLKWLISRDIPYAGLLADEETAGLLARQIVEELAMEGCRCFTNGPWHRCRADEPFAYHPFTASTFDGGVIFYRADRAACVWFEDED